MTTPQEIFETGLMYHHYANTAYPLTPGSFREYRLQDPAAIAGFLQNEWAKPQELSLYVHIPFCSVRCRFCEYTVLPEWTSEAEAEYVDLLLREIALYAPLLAGKTITGFDMGGGTPTKISTEHIRTITTAEIWLPFSFPETYDSRSFASTPVWCDSTPPGRFQGFPGNTKTPAFSAEPQGTGLSRTRKRRVRPF